MGMYPGLTTDEVVAQRREFGKNELPEPKLSLLKFVWREMRSVFMLILFVASGITLMLGEVFDALFILVFVVLGVGLSVFQEYKSGAAAKKLKSYLVSSITVRRNDREEEVLVTELVPGDIVKLETGDMVPADAEVIETTGLMVDETTFTGESYPVAKVVAGLETAEASADLLQGTTVVRGLAYARVTHTGTRTRLAKIAKNTFVTEPASNLMKSVGKISTFIIWMAVITLALVLAANLVINSGNHDLPHLLIFAIVLAISVIPETLPLVVTFSLSYGATRLAKRGVIVKRLSAVQDLGAVDLLCTDKTGTITENRLTYQKDWQARGSAWSPLILSSLVAHNLRRKQPEPFDLATDNALTATERAVVEEFTLLEEIPFDPQSRSNGARVQHNLSGKELTIRRGSPEYFLATGLIPPTDMTDWLVAAESLGQRVLGLSYDDGTGVQFAGLIAFADVLKESTTDTLAEAKRLNVGVTIITGDSLLVAEAIGREAGLVTSRQEVMMASEFLQLPVVEQHERVGKIRVFARTTPEEKLSLIALLKEQYTVGFLGEGINDAPALRAADVSLVVKSVSDVSREVADVVLLESDLRVIIDGIHYGRETHANTLKYIRTTLVSNFGNFYAVAISSLFVSFLPMLPKQILLLNLMSDFPMLAVAFDRVSRDEIRHPQKYNFRGLYITFITLGLVSTVFDFVWFGLFFRDGAGVLQTNWFIASVLTEVVLLFSIRSWLPLRQAGWPAKPIMWISILIIAFTIAAPFIPLTAHYFEFIAPRPIHLVWIVGLTGVYFVATEITKRFLQRMRVAG